MQVRCGGVAVTIYRTVHKQGHVCFVVADYSSGKRVLRSFSDLVQAKAEAERIALQMLRGEVGVVSLTATQKLSYVRAAQALEAAAVPVDLVAIQFAEAQKVLKGVSCEQAQRGLHIKLVAEAGFFILITGQAHWRLVSIHAEGLWRCS